MKAEIISIGNELLIGQVINTNASFIAEQLNAIGIEISRISIVGDTLSEIVGNLSESYQRAKIILVTGGLGPTHDDVTKQAICEFFQTDLIFNEQASESIKNFLIQRNLTWSSTAEEQAMVPRIASIIPNRHGTAPGLIIEKDEHIIIFMPGVPHEMETMIKDFVIPYLRNKSQGKVILHRTLNTTGLPESVLFEKLGNLDNLLQGATLAFLPSPGCVRLRISTKCPTLEEAQKTILSIESRIRSLIGDYIFGTNGETLEEVVGKLLANAHLKLAIAESCTGGLIAHKITNVPGSSRYFERAIITYSNESKIEQLGVPANLIEKFGAVSSEVAQAMAFGVRTVANTSIGISTTGIAGPTGGSTEKPVGLVWIGYSDKQTTLAKRFHFGSDRLRIKERASQAALELLRRMLLKINLE